MVGSWLGFRTGFGFGVGVGVGVGVGGGVGVGVGSGFGSTFPVNVADETNVPSIPFTYTICSSTFSKAPVVIEPEMVPFAFA
ncbi:MAG TPA: hypothetical protein DEA91_17750 [Paenibacillus sp.]|nr:hypothetical protein [Paenibacillus sp.]